PTVRAARGPDGGDERHVTAFGMGGAAAQQALAEAGEGTHPGSLMGTALRGSHTPLYASPQQMRGEPPDPRDDVHALGVIWYQLLAGDFSVGAPAGSAWRNALTQRGLSDPLLHLLESCFETEAAHRPPHAGAVAEGIEANLGKKSPPIGTGSPPSELERDLKEALEEGRKTSSDLAFLERQAPKRIEAWKTAAKQGKPAAQYLLARCLQEGLGIEKFPQVA